MTEPAQGRRTWYRRFPAIATFTILAAVVAASGIIAIVLSGRAESPKTLGPTENVEIAQWWSSTYPHVANLQDSLDGSRQALTHMDRPALTAACQRMHDAAGVGLVAHLPAPDDDLTAELDAAATDAHNAAHMCLAVLEQTRNNYDAEFTTHVDQADQHLKAAVAIVNRSLTHAAHASSRR